MFRECFMLHRTTKSVFAIDSLVEMGEANILHPLLRAGSIMAGNFGRVSLCPRQESQKLICRYYFLLHTHVT